MPARTNPYTSTQREKVVYFAMLRQMETPCQAMRDAFQRLADAASVSTSWNAKTLILDWLEAELKTLRQTGQDDAGRGRQFMKAALAISNALGQ